jgi:hypothetical protein
LPCPRAYSSIARDTTCGDPVAVKVIGSFIVRAVRATLAQWSNQLEAEV